MRYLILLLAFATAGCASQYGTTPTTALPPSGHAPLPLDPLTDTEAARARELAMSDGATRELLGDDPRLIYALSIAPKLSEDGEPRGRHADLLYRRADLTSGVRILVDLAAGRVVDRVRVVSTSLPIGTADVEEALEIARSSGELQQFLRSFGPAESFHVLSGPLTRERAMENFVQGLQHVSANPDDPCRMNRCIVLVFNSGGREILPDQEVLVDLNTRRVLVTRTGGAQ